MFTGIIQALGEVERLEPRSGDLRLHLRTGALDLTRVALGDSIAVNGVCLTAVALRPGARSATRSANPTKSGGGFAADVSRETLSLTSLGGLGPGARVNLETALTLATPLGGHLVSGHVDGLGTVLEVREDARSWRLRLQAPAALARYIAPKGSIAIDGTSLTVNTVDGAVFDVNIVPHTLAATIIGGYRAGSQVNLEVDLIARYLERLLLGERAATPGAGAPDANRQSVSDAGSGAISEAFLRQHGFG